MTELCKLAEKHGTDKLGFYTPFYDALLRRRRFMLRRMLEIGIGTPETMAHVKGYQAGASLRMWREYFPGAEIIGIDIDARAVADAAGHRISTFLCSQTYEARLREIAHEGHFDLIVDDGSHVVSDQLDSLRILFPFLMPRGLYIIEDASEGLSVHIPLEHSFVYHHHAGLTGKAILIYGNAE